MKSPVTNETRARILAVAGRRLTEAEAAAYLDAPVTEEERATVIDLVRWFTRRYPTPLERLAYVRQAHARWRPGGDAPGVAPRE